MGSAEGWHGPGGGLARDVALMGTVWGLSVVLQRAALAELAPVPLAALRLAAALCFFLPFACRIRRGLGARPRVLAEIAALGALNPALSTVLSALALQFASSGLVALLTSLGPIFAALLSGLPGPGEPPGRGRLGGMALAFAGVAVLVASGSSGLGPGSEGDYRGYALGLGLALTLALAAVYARRRLAGVDPVAVAAGQVSAGLLLVLTPLLVVGQPVDPSGLSGETWAAIALSGAIGLGGAFVLLSDMVNRHGAAGALLTLYVVPVVAGAAGVLLLGETITAAMLAGAGLVAAGLLLFGRA